MKLDLGAGSCPREGFTGVDIVKIGDGIAFDLVSGLRWPWETSSIEELASSHFIEHIPNDNVMTMSERPCPCGAANCRSRQQVRKDALFFFFDEAFRVIQPGGLFYLTWPALKSSDAFRDPTHRRFIPLEMLHYLSIGGRAAMGISHYEASCNWVTVEDSCRYHGCAVDPEEVNDVESVWEGAKAISVILRAEK